MTVRKAGLIATLVLGLIISGPLSAVGPPTAAADDGAGKLLLLLDSSGSMKEPAGGGQTKIAAAKTAVTKIIDGLPEQAQVGLRVYGATVFDRKNKGACSDTQLAVPIGSGNEARLKAAVARLKPYGETPIAHSLEQAAKDLGAAGRRSILLVSDGEETCVPDPCPVAAKLAASGVELRIDVIGFRVGGKARKQLRCIAEKGNGDYTDADDAEDLERNLSQLSSRAFRPFRFGGTSVTGADRPESAPELVPGTWLDRMADGDATKFYRLRRSQPGSTFWIGAGLLAPPGLLIQLSLRLYAPDDLDSPCANAKPNLTNWTGGRRLLTGFVISQSGDEACTRSAELLLAVGAGALTRELGGDPIELRVGEEPPLRDRSELPAAAGTPNWRAMSPSRPTPTVGGTSFGDAPTLRPGTHATDIAPGELQTYRVRVGWGQRLQVLASTARLTDADRRLVGIGRHVELGLLSPFGGPAEIFNVRDAPAPTTTPIGPDGSLVAASTKEVRWLNREDSREHDHGAGLAGDFFITVRLDGADGDPPFAVPIKLTVAVVGKEQNPPPYQRAVPPTPTPTSSTPSVTSAPPDPIPSGAGPVVPPSPGPPWWPLAAVGGAVLLLLGGTAALLRLRRRQTGSSPPSIS